MSNDYFNASGAPSSRSSGSSSVVRSEFASIGDAFDKLPPMSGHGLELVRVNAGGTALESVDPATLTTDIAVDTHAATGKTTPVDADEMPLVDSAASNVLKKVTWANIKATLKTYFDTLYATFAAVQGQTYTAFTTGGTSTAFTLTPSPAITANTTGQRFRVTFNNAAGATPTLAVSGQTAKNLKYKDSTGTKQAVTSTQIPSGWVADVEYDGTDWVVLDVPPPASATSALPTLFYAGFQSTWASTTTETVGTGKARDSGDANDLSLGSSITGTLQASGSWTAGNAQNKLDTGARANSTVYHKHIIRKTADNTCDWLYSTSATSGGVTLPSGYAYGRRVKGGQCITDGSSNIRKTFPWGQFGQDFDVGINDVAAATNPGTAAVTRTLTVPTGVRVRAKFDNSESNQTSNRFVLWTALEQTDSTPAISLNSLNVSNASGIKVNGHFHIKTNTSAQVRYRSSASGASDETNVVTKGWIDDVEID